MLEIRIPLPIANVECSWAEFDQAEVLRASLAGSTKRRSCRCDAILHHLTWLEVFNSYGVGMLPSLIFARVVLTCHTCKHHVHVWCGWSRGAEWLLLFVWLLAVQSSLMVLEVTLELCPQFPSPKL